MSLSSLLVDDEEFEPVRCSEEVLEGLLRTQGSKVFPGLAYYDFRPPIQSIAGTRHPDGALLAPGYDRWWVVEVEVHTHSVADHIEPQLSALREGLYGPSAFGYLARHGDFDAETHAGLDIWQPSFLLIVDQATAEIRAAAGRCEFNVIECGVFRSRLNRYALAVSGDRPRRDARALPAGVDVTPHNEAGVCLLRPLLPIAIPTGIPGEIVVGGRAIKKRVTTDGAAVVLSLDLAELFALTGIASTYRLTFDGHLFPVTSDDGVEPADSQGGSSS